MILSALTVKPPYHITDTILRCVGEIHRLLGRYEGFHGQPPAPMLRKRNRIRTILGSVAIEGNTLKMSQVTALFDHKRVVGPAREVREVQNALTLYEELPSFNPFQIADLLRGHGVLMRGLVPDAGCFRRGAVGIFKGSAVTHVAPPAHRVPTLIAELFRYARRTKTISPLILACLVHYELEFIHPFSDGNGRIGRAWQSLLLQRVHPAFEFIPVESVIQQRQKAYYRALAAADRAGEATPFIEFALQAIADALHEFIVDVAPVRSTPQARLAIAKAAFGGTAFSRKQYVNLVGGVSTATASRDLAGAVRGGTLILRGMQATARYRFR